MNALDLLAHLRRASGRPEPAPDDHHTATQTRGTPDPTPPATPATPRLPERPAPRGPLHRLPGQAWPSPRTWLTATLTDADTAREARQVARLAALTDQLGTPLAAAQAEFAPHLRKDHQP